MTQRSVPQLMAVAFVQLSWSSHLFLQPAALTEGLKVVFLSSAKALTHPFRRGAGGRGEQEWGEKGLVVSWFRHKLIEILSASALQNMIRPILHV